MRTLLEGDVLHRARLFAEHGADRLLGDLGSSVTWDEDTLYVGHHYVRGSRQLGGRGLLLVPSVFVWPRVFSVIGPNWQPILRYPPRGVAGLWERRSALPQALAAVVGRSRARLLAELDTPASTIDLARRTGITPGGVSQHLTALRAAGLVNAHRSGRYVLYVRTEAAEVLLAAADARGDEGIVLPGGVPCCYPVDGLARVALLSRGDEQREERSGLSRPAAVPHGAFQGPWRRRPADR